jgi:hypothetical protein
MNRQRSKPTARVSHPALEDGRTRYRTRADSTEPVEALDVPTIADLPDRTIAAMTRDELVRVILAGGVPLAPGFDPEHLRYRDRSTLERLAYLARRTCRNRLREQETVPSGRALRACLQREVT